MSDFAEIIIFCITMQRKILLCFIVLCVNCFYVNSMKNPSSLDTDFNFNGNVRKVNHLTFNSYFFGRGQTAVPNLNNKVTIKNPKSSPEIDSEQEGSDDDSDDDYLGGDNEEICEDTSAFTLTGDEEQSILISGLPVDYSFNETLAAGDPKNNLTSAPGCPASGEKDDVETYIFSNRSIWVHYGNPPKCYLVGTQGPCRAGMRLGLQSNSYVGKCKCKCFVEVTKRTTVAKHRVSNLDPFLDEKQSFCFDYDKGHFSMLEDKCYMLFSQGPCRSNEAFVLNTTKNSPSCQLRECPEIETDESESLKFGYSVKHNGKCLKLGQECGNSSKAEVKFYVGTTIENPMPSCISGEDTLELAKDSYSSGKSLEPIECAKRNQTFSPLLRRCIPYRILGRSGGVG